MVSYALAGATYLYPATEQLTNGALDNIFNQYFPTHELGVQDMVPDSDFLKELASSLVHNAIPILALAGNNGNVEKFIDYSAIELEGYAPYLRNIPSGWLNGVYANIFAGGCLVDHDLMVPLYSQLPQNITKNDSFKTYLVEGAVHDFLPGLSISPDKVIYNHIETIERIVEFAESNFSFKKRKDTCCLS